MNASPAYTANWGADRAHTIANTTIAPIMAILANLAAVSAKERANVIEMTPSLGTYSQDIRDRTQ